MSQEAKNNRTGDTVSYFTAIRVKLPSSGGYHSSPSGDAEYEKAYKDAIFKAKPAGFEVKWPRANEKWPVDSEGYTFVPLYLTQAADAVAHWQEQADMYRVKYETLQNKVLKLAECV